MSEERQIRVLVAREGDYWVAQCLELDIGAQATDLADLGDRLLVAIDAERRESLRRHGKPFAGIAPAPAYFHERWERRAGRFTPTHETAAGDEGIEIEYGMAA